MIRKALPRMFGRRRAATIVGVALVASFLTACGSGGGSSSAGSTAGMQSATGFVRQITTEFARGQAGRLWDTLHPADQAIVTRDRYTACQTNSGFDLKSFKVLETYADPVTVAGKSTPCNGDLGAGDVGRWRDNSDDARDPGQGWVALDPVAGRLRGLQAGQLPADVVRVVVE